MFRLVSRIPERVLTLLLFSIVLAIGVLITGLSMPPAVLGIWQQDFDNQLAAQVYHPSLLIGMLLIVCSPLIGPAFATRLKLICRDSSR